LLASALLPTAAVLLAATKAVVFENLKVLMNPGGVVFGATLLHDGVRRNWLARQVMDRNNKHGILRQRQRQSRWSAVGIVPALHRLGGRGRWLCRDLHGFPLSRSENRGALGLACSPVS
jgi:hypothetical protein